MTDIPENPVRDANIMQTADHLNNQMKDRDILWSQIEMAIEDGSIEDSVGEDNILYRLEIPGVDLLVGVDTSKGENGRIVTTYYDDEQGAQGGGLGGTRFSIAL